MMCWSENAGRIDYVQIPATLLQDPIRNGCEFIECGLNQWNEEQKVRIASHLEKELLRLTDEFQRDASARGSDVLPVAT